MALAGILSRLEAADLADGIPKDFDIFIQKNWFKIFHHVFEFSGAISSNSSEIVIELKSPFAPRFGQPIFGPRADSTGF